MTKDAPHIVLCNGGELAGSAGSARVRQLHYLDEAKRNVNILLPDFVKGVYHLPDRILDLLEIAAFIYCCDRLIPRGSRDAVEYHAWARTFKLVIRVRDDAFWNRPEVKEALEDALRFVTGDREFAFDFQGGHSTPRTSLFDREEFSPAGETNDVSIMLFSGGLDSLAGALERLGTTEERVCLVSHQSLQPRTIRTQQRLVDSLRSMYPERVFHYRFRCSLRGIRAAEETQRSRSFLYASVAFALACAYEQRRFYVYENGVTSINFARRGDLANARASRTTHPQTMGLLERLFGLLADQPVRIDVPYLWKTKAEVFESIKRDGHAGLISSAVSCNRTFQARSQATHCGHCFQCVDRRLAAYASGCEEFDGSGIYAADFISETIGCGEARTTVVDYLRQAGHFAKWNVDYFYERMLGELSELVEWVPCCSEDEVTESVWELCRRHGVQVFRAIGRMRDLHDDLHQRIEEGSLLAMVSEREYLKEPIERLVSSISQIVENAIPAMFRENPPRDERDLNRKIEALLDSHLIELRSEHPAVSFAGARAVPDHSSPRDLFLETKYIRGSTSPSVATEGIAADLTKYPEGVHILFMVYDPTHRIASDREFVRDIEGKGRSTVLILR